MFKVLFIFWIPLGIAGRRVLAAWLAVLLLGMGLPGRSGVRHAGAADPSLPLVTGAFIQLHGGLASRSAAWWQTELGA